MDLADRGIQRRATSVLGGDRKVKSSLTRASSSFIIFLDARSWTPWAWDGMGKGCQLGYRGRPADSESG